MQNDQSSNAIEAPSISLPKGGGAIAEMGETFKSNVLTGTGSYAIPIPISSARGFEPELSLTYNSGAGNSPFGMGFSVTVPKFSIRTEKGIPSYTDKDVFLYNGNELVVEDGTQSIDNQGWSVKRYLPRVIDSFSVIEQHVSQDKNESYWIIRNLDNEVSYFGESADSRINNPTNPSQIFEWLINRSTDSKGNKIIYDYKAENNEGTENKIWEVNRSFNNKYLEKISYGNFVDSLGVEQFAFQTIFNYGEYDLSTLDSSGIFDITPTQKWAYRYDAFSSYKSGFEIRTCRLCESIMLIHNFEQELGDPSLIKNMLLKYTEPQQYNKVDAGGPSMLFSVQIVGYKRTGKNATDKYTFKKMPATKFGFSRFVPPVGPEFKTLSSNFMGIPGYLNQSAFLPVDLYGEGISGLLYSNESIYYLSPEGEGKYSSPREVACFPMHSELVDGKNSLVDLEGNGELELVVKSENYAGYYLKGSEEEWHNFVSFNSFPINSANDNIEFVGLSNNGKTDLLLVEENDLLIYPSLGKEGYAPAERKSKQEEFPSIKQNYKKEYVRFSNIFGDGLSHRVRISNGMIECWPDFGYGGFGKKVVLGGAPDFGDNFDITNLYLTDIDGSGTTDMAYVNFDSVDIYLNQSGNYFSTPIHIQLPELYSSMDQIAFSDILGNGTNCLVFTKMTPTPKHYFYNFVGEIELNGIPQKSMKPYMLNQIDNNLGGISYITYKSSTQDYLEDKKKGNPWATKLPFPIQVVEKIIQIEQFSGARYTNSYKYHDGYYDHVERVFRGFGFVETWDSENYEDLTLFSEQFLLQENFVPPVYTKLWHCTGASFDNPSIMLNYKENFFQGDPDAYDFPDPIFEKTIFEQGTATIRQAYIALNGQVIRKEIYSDDQIQNPEIYQNPYTVEQSNQKVNLKQIKGDNPYAVFLVNGRESIVYNYERNPQDPRVQQKFVLNTDFFGNNLQYCIIDLPRRTGISEPIYPEQLEIKGILSWDQFVTPPEDNAYCKISCEQQNFELSGLNLNSRSYFSFDTIKTEVSNIGWPSRNNIIPYGQAFTTGVQARQLTWERSLFWNEAQTDMLPLGLISSRALLHSEHKTVFTKDLTIQDFDGRLVDNNSYVGDEYYNTIIYTLGGYFYDVNSEYWWNKGLVQHYELPAVPAGYFQPSYTENTFAKNTQGTTYPQDPSLCSKSTLKYDSYYILQTELTEQIDFGVSISSYIQNDYMSLQAKQLMDPNDVITQVLFDELGLVIVTSKFGTENDKKTGGMTLYPDGAIPADYELPATATFNDVIANPINYLQGAATFFYYNVDAWEINKQPASSIHLTRINNWLPSKTNKSPYCEILINYNDGLGRDIEKKQKVDGEFSILEESVSNLAYNNNNNFDVISPLDRWKVTGRTVYNNKGKAFEQYLPYFTNTPNYEEQEYIIGPPPTVIFYDPLEREIRTNTPKGFFTKKEITPWEEVYYDEDDTILDSEYYIDNYPSNVSQSEKEALEKASIFYNTPTINIINNSGYRFQEIENNLGNVEPQLFANILGTTGITANEIWNELLFQGYLIQDRTFAWLTAKFRPYGVNFKLILDPKFDPLLVSITNLLLQNNLTSYYNVDMLGNVIESIDPRLYYSNITNDTNYFNFRYVYVMSNENAVVVNSTDAGKKNNLPNIYMEQLWTWSPRDYCQLINYDQLQRKTKLWVKKINSIGPVTDYSDFNLVEMFQYGESITDAKKNNLNGELYMLKDLSGITTNISYSISREILINTKQLVKAYKTAVNWNNVVDLEVDVYSSSFTYNAVGAIVSETSPDDSIITNNYTQFGKLYSVNIEFSDGRRQDIITSIEYDPNDNRTLVNYGNGIVSNYIYEITTLRLLQLLSRKTPPLGSNKIQDISYCYDPVGNITQVIDGTIDTVFNKNQKIDPISNYTYDALYQIKLANGRQHIGINAGTYQNNPPDFKQCIFGPLPSVNDTGQLENYNESYSYDNSGNLVKVHHTSLSATWNRENPVENDSNRLSQYNYDDAGNLRNIIINSPVNLSFNCCENMVKAAIIIRPGEEDDSDYYVYDWDELRTRKVSERMAHSGTVTLIEDKSYIGNYEIKRKYSGSIIDPSTLNYERQTIRIMDGNTCIAIIQNIVKDTSGTVTVPKRTIRFQMGNNIGSISLEYNEIAQLISYEEYFPFGGTAIITGETQAEVKLKVYRYSGKERDDSTGLYYYGQRYYAPWQGRWLKPDPAGTVDGMNLYCFVKNNPIVNKDNEGLSIQPERTRLFLGESDFSYARAYALKHYDSGRASTMIATTYETLDQLKQLSFYKTMQQNQMDLELLGVNVYYGVDATDATTWPEDISTQVEHIYFSHPHTQSRTYHTSNVLEGLFKETSTYASLDTQIHIPRVWKRKNKKSVVSGIESMYGFTKVLDSTLEDTWQLVKKHKFSSIRYPGYGHTMTQGGGSADVTKNGSVEFVFQPGSGSKYKDSRFDVVSDNESEDEDVMDDGSGFNQFKHMFYSGQLKFDSGLH